jgi:hypothetical protein
MMMTPERRGKTSNKEKLLLGIFRVATIDTTNKEPCPEVPRQPKGELVKLSIFMHRVDRRDTTNKSFCSMLFGSTPLTRVVAPLMMMHIYRDLQMSDLLG